MIYRKAFNAVADVAEISVFGIYLLEILAGVLGIAFRLISSGKFVPKALFLVAGQVGRLERPQKPLKTRDSAYSVP